MVGHLNSPWEIIKLLVLCRIKVTKIISSAVVYSAQKNYNISSEEY